MRREHAGHAFPAENRAVHVWLLEHHARVIDQITRWKIVRAVEDKIVVLDDLERVLAGQLDGVGDEIEVRIDRLEFILGALELVFPDVTREMNDLSLEIAEIDCVELDHPDRAHSRRRQVQGNRRTESARADEQHLRSLEPLLSLNADLRAGSGAANTF